MIAGLKNKKKIKTAGAKRKQKIFMANANKVNALCIKNEQKSLHKIEYFRSRTVEIVFNTGKL